MGQHTPTSQGPRRPSAGGMRSKDKNTLSNIMCIAAHRSGITRISEKQAGGELRAKNLTKSETGGGGGGGWYLTEPKQRNNISQYNNNSTTTQYSRKQAGGKFRSNKLIKLTKLDTGGDLGTSHNHSSTTTSVNTTITTQQPCTESRASNNK